MAHKTQIGAEVVDMTEEQLTALVGERIVTAVQVKAEAARRLSATDWLVLRHRDQVDAGGPTSLSPEAAGVLLVSRQAIRDASNAIEAMEPIPADFTADGYWPGE